MGAFKKWLKSVMGLEKSDSNGEENVKGTDRRNRNLWKSPSVDRSSVRCFGRRKEAVDTGASDSSVSGDGDVFSAAVATIIRVPPKDFMVIRREWASVRIQTAFRAFLARRAFRALKAVVRLQALVRGRQVRKQAAVTLQCMQALVRVQAQVRARNQANLIKQAEERWCNSSGSMRQVRKKLQMRRGEALTRERAIPYSLSRGKLRSSPSSSPMHNKSAASLKHRRKYLNNLVEEFHTYPSDTYSSSKKGEGHTSGYNHANARRNNLTKRNSIKKPLQTQQVKSSASGSSSEFPPECSSSASSNSSMKESDGSTTSNPSYMNPTKSIKAKQRENMMRHVMEDFPFMNSVAPSVGNTRRSTGFHQSNWIDMRG